jgi:lipid II:glycine glycyltransferase (peptidoglycan interpeptide bridge formation enzyme)
MKIEEIKLRDEWNNLFCQAKKVNISQDWDYGLFKDAKSDILVKRYKIIHNNNVVAIFQLFQKQIKYLKFFKLFYLNRGPIIIDPKVRYEKIFNKISKNFSIFRGQVFLINPFSSLNNNIIKILKKNFYCGFKSSIYETSYIDLSENIEVLRSNLHSKWRNQLVKAEKNKIDISYFTNNEKLDFILSSYNEMINKKNFDGLSITELKTLLKIYINEKKFVSLIASDENKNIIGFTILLTFSKSSLYFIGWANNNGRKFNVSNLLLWNSIVYLKEKNFKEFDLGGYDSKNLPGIASFKKRIGGLQVKYIERWLKLY